MMETVKRSAVARTQWGKGVVRGMNGQSTRDFYGSKTTLYSVIKINIYHYTLAQTRKYTTPRENANVNCGRQVIKMYQCTFIISNKCTTVMGYVGKLSSSEYWGTGSIREIDVPSPLNFALNLKLLYKNNLKKYTGWDYQQISG